MSDQDLKTVRDRVNFLDCPFDPVLMDEALDQCITWSNDDSRSRTVVTINAAILTAMRRDTELAHACVAGDLIVADGVPIVWGSRFVGSPLPGRVAGVDLMARILEVASRHALRAYFLGATEEVVTSLVRKLEQDSPGIVAGYRNGYFGAGEHNQIINEIRASKAQILFVGMPTPFKEIWCERHRDALGTPLIMGVGGSFDVLAGFTRRAPLWMQNIGMEWFWRFLMEPRRMWKRYLTANTRYVCMVLGERLRRGKKATGRISSSEGKTVEKRS